MVLVLTVDYPTPPLPHRGHCNHACIPAHALQVNHRGGVPHALPGGWLTGQDSRLTYRMPDGTGTGGGGEGPSDDVLWLCVLLLVGVCDGCSHRTLESLVGFHLLGYVVSNSLSEIWEYLPLWHIM